MSDFQRKKIRPWDDIEALMPISNQKVTSNEPISNQLVTIKESDPVSISNQLVIQLVINNDAKTAIKRLCGLQRKILFYIVEQCVSDGHLASGPITNEKLREITGTNADTIKTAIQRLIGKRLVQRVEGKRGKGGFASFSINKDIRGAVLEEQKHKLLSNQLVTLQGTDNSNQLVTNKEPYKEPNPPSSSNNLINNKNTTTELPPEWQEINLTQLHERNVRFGKEHIIQLFPFLEKHSAFDFQESVDAFAYDIDHGHVSGKKGLLNLFIGAIRNGTLYLSSHYVSSYQQKLNEMAKLAKQRAEQAFLAWVEENRAEILKQVENHDMSLAIDFKHGGKESLHWVKQHLFLKKA